MMNFRQVHRRIVGLGCLASILAIVSATSGVVQAATSLRVMTYNIWVGGAAAGPLSQTVGVIQTAAADVIGIQEQGSNGQAIATALGFHYQSLGGSTAILSRYPVSQVLNQGVRLQLSPTMDAYVFDVHLTAYPYQPYDIRDGLITNEAQAIASAQATRSMAATLASMSPALGSGAPVFLTGDFNEPSHLDWTQEAADAGMHFGMKVDWPTSRSVTNAGLFDAFRELRPDEIGDLGNTWTPGYPAPNLDPTEVQDRIDMVYYAGLDVTPTSADILGYNSADGSTDIAIQPYPSDHRAVVVEFDLPSCFAVGDVTGDCTLNVADWTQFRGGQHADMAGLSHGQTLALGDLNGDFKNDHADFVLFKGYYEAANGSGSFAAMLSAVPEPASAGLVVWAAFAMLVRGHRAVRAGGRASLPGREFLGVRHRCSKLPPWVLRIYGTPRCSAFAQVLSGWLNGDEAHGDGSCAQYQRKPRWTPRAVATDGIREYLYSNAA